VPDASDVILLTGAGGFIGSHTAEALLASGATVVGLENFDSFYDPAIKHRNIDELRAHPQAGNFTLVESDLCDIPSVDALFEKHQFTGVIHLAARAGVRPSIAEPSLYAKVNVEGTNTLLEAARRTQSVTRFVLASSSSVYGNNEKVPFAETDDVNEPISPYAATKRACELISHTFHHLYGMPIACLRFFTVYGPRQRPDLAISKFMRLISSGEPIPMFGNGQTSRDYTFIEDIVAGVLASYDRIPEYGFRIWNLGGNEPVTLDDMIGTIERVIGQSAALDHQPAQMGDVNRTFADLTRSAAELDYAPKVSFQEGVRRQWEWTKQRLAASAG
jgi:UDP-glucuronate 4-epimerase